MLRSETSANAMKSHHSPSSFDSIKTFLPCLLHFLNVFACLHAHTHGHLGPKRNATKQNSTHTHCAVCAVCCFHPCEAALIDCLVDLLYRAVEKDKAFTAAGAAPEEVFTTPAPTALCLCCFFIFFCPLATHTRPGGNLRRRRRRRESGWQRREPV